MESSDIDYLLPSRQEMFSMDKLCDISRGKDSVTVCFQRDGTTLSKVRALVDTAILQSPSTAKRISPRYFIVMSLTFESGILKDYVTAPCELDDMAKAALSLLPLPESSDEETE